MICRSAKKTVGNEPRARQFLKVITSGCSPSSRRNGNVQRQFVSSSFGRHSGREASHPVRGFAIVQNTVPDVPITCRRLEDVPEFPFRKEWITEQVGTTGRRECSYSGWSFSNPGGCQNQRSSLLAPWNRRGTTRLLSTNSKEGDDTISKESDDGQSTSDEEETQTKEEVPTRPKTIDDFQHEEIVGPTVERDLSDTANEVRASLDQLTGFMSSLKTGLVLLGSVQLLATLWSSYFHGVGLIFGLSQGLTFVMSFILAYLLQLFGSRVEFFSKIEGRSRMRVLTLSLMVNKMLKTFFFRSSFVVKAVAVLSLLALIGDVWHSHLSIL